MTSPIPEWNDEVVPAQPRRKPSHSSAPGCLVVMFLCAAIVVAAAILGIQTKVGCEVVADTLRRQTGLDLTIGGASLVWPLDIVLTDVQTKPSTTPLGSFKAREIIIGLRWGNAVTLSMRGGRLEMVKIADGWVPAVLEKIGSLSDVRDTAALVTADPRLVALDIRDSSILWSGADGDRVASADGVGISMRPVTLGDRRLTVMEVTARSVYRTGGVKGLNARRLWLSSGENPYLEVEYQVIWDGPDAALRDWWSVPPRTGETRNGK